MEKVKASMFTSVEEYTIETYPFGKVAKRKAPEFEWLREKLVGDFPGLYVILNVIRSHQ